MSDKVVKFGDIEYEQNTNNPNNYSERKRSEDIKNYILERGSDSRSDSYGVMRKISNEAMSHIALIQFTDPHIGGQGFMADRLQMSIDGARMLWNSICILGGDAQDMGTKSSTTNVYGNRISPLQSVDATCYYFDSIKNKLVAVLGGNHNAEFGKRLQDSGMSPAKHVADKLGVDYVPFGLLYEVPILTPDTCEPKMMQIFSFHSNIKGNKYSATNGTLTGALNLLSDYNIVPDIIIGEHLHADSTGLFFVKHPYYDNAGQRLGDRNKPIYVYSGNTMQGSNTEYRNVSCFAETITNYDVLDISWQRNQYYTKNKDNIEFQYIPRVNQFSILKDNYNEYSSVFMAYMNKYGIDEMTDAKENNNLSKLSLQEISKLFQKTTANCYSSIMKYVTKTKQANSKINKTKKTKNQENENNTEHNSDEESNLNID